MKLNLDTINKILNGLVDGIANKAIFTGLVPKFWQLYLDAKVELGLDIVDTCATSQCLSVLAKAKYNDTDLISEAVASVVRLRNEEGSWPSAITPDELKNPEKRRKGDTAIGDNCFALTALIDANFLGDDFIYVKHLSENYKDLYYRISFILASVDWLLENKAKDGVGWYYTDNRKAKSESVTLTTLNVLQTFSEIIYYLKKCSINNKLSYPQQNTCRIYIDKMEKQLKTIVDVLVDTNNIYENIQNQWLAIGAKITTDEPSIVHTCKLLNLLIYNKEHNQLLLYNDDSIEDLIRFIFDNVRSDGNLSKYCEPFYYEYYELKKISDLGLCTRTIYVEHENFAEGIILFTTINIGKYRRKFETNVITNMIKSITVPERMSSSRPYFFLCRSKREEKNKWYCPVYSSYEAYRALKNYIDNYNNIYNALV